MLTKESALRKDQTTKATLQHRHFAFIAATIAALPREGGMRSTVACHFADACAETNPNFDRARFMRACEQVPV